MGSPLHGATVKVTTLLDEPMEAVMGTDVTFRTLLVLIKNVAAVPPAFTVTRADTDTTVG